MHGVGRLTQYLAPKNLCPRRHQHHEQKDPERLAERRDRGPGDQGEVDRRRNRVRAGAMVAHVWR